MLNLPAEMMNIYLLTLSTLLLDSLVYIWEEIDSTLLSVETSKAGCSKVDLALLLKIIMKDFMQKLKMMKAETMLFIILSLMLFKMKTILYKLFMKIPFPLRRYKHIE
jgi:hypothetical protein